MEKFEFKNCGKLYHLVNRDYNEFHGITLAFITLNEERDIVEFINHVKPLVKKIVMIDGGSTDQTVGLATPLVDHITTIPFNGHFGNQKNNAISLSMTDWTLFLDPDERMSEELIKKLPSLIEQDEFDCYSFPRREFLSGAENKEPYPDYQDRLFRTYCRYVRPIHHELVGYKNKFSFPQNGGVELIHSKEIDRHISRNRGYDLFELNYKNEMSYPGAQMEETFKKAFPDLNRKLL